MGKSIRRKILLKGVTTTPDDYLCEDGELAAGIGVDNNTGGMQSTSVHGPKIVLRMKESTCRVIFEHDVKPKPNYIAWDDVTGEIGWLRLSASVDEDGNDLWELADQDSKFGITSETKPLVEAIGNTLIISTMEEDGPKLYYVLWKYESDSNRYWYKMLGTHIPEIGIQFGTRIWSVGGYTDIEGLEDYEDGKPISNENQQIIIESIRANINRMHYEQMKKGLFVQPFLVRYALRLFDNTTTMASIPVLMPLTTLNEKGAFPYCMISLVQDAEDKLEVRNLVMTARLYMNVLSYDQVRRLMDWSDIVKSVEIYVSAPIYTYTENKGEVKIIEDNEPTTRYTIGQKWNTDSDREPGTSDDAPWKKYNHYEFIYSQGGQIHKTFDIEYKRKQDFDQEIKDCSLFYKLTSYNLDDLTQGLMKLKFDENVLNIITTRPVLEDEYQSHDTIRGRYIKTYNSRLNMSDITRELYGWWQPEIMIPYMTLPYEDRAETIRCRIAIETANEGVTSVVHSMTSGPLPYNQCWPYLYYPNTGAKRITIEKVGLEEGTVLTMDSHNGLNGAVMYDGDLHDAYETMNHQIRFPAAINTEISLGSKIYTSEAENPWRFLPTNINTIGTGRILGMAAVTTALSQGQHGSFPMYCFTTEGIYSLSVNKTGGWAPSQTVTRDVMRESTALLQIDDAIVFVSDQGVMLLQGDKTALVSGDQQMKQSLKINSLTGLETVLQDYSGLTDIGKLANIQELAEMLCETVMEYISHGYVDMYYDYTNQRVVVAKDEANYCWVYSLAQKTWLMQPWHLLNSINSYPECYAMYKAEGRNYMVQLNTSESMNEGDDSGTELGIPEGMLMLTRPIKLDELTDELKELENMTVEGRFGKQKIGLIVYGTRNYKDWHLVGSCKGGHLVRKHGSGYRAFVVAILGKLDKTDYLDSITLQVQPRYTQKMHGMGYTGG